MSADSWQSETCSVCDDPLCDARCESQIPQNMVVAGFVGVGILVAGLLLKWILTS